MRPSACRSVTGSHLDSSWGPPEMARSLKKRDAGRTFFDVPLILPRREQRKIDPHAYLWHLFDLFFQEFIKSPESTWESFGSSLGPPWDLTSTSHQAHIDLTSTSQRTKPIYKYFIGSGTPDSSPSATVCYFQMLAVFHCCI